MLFLNISADKIHAIVDGNETIIEHGDLEKSIADFLYQQQELKQVFIINGPGSFTNLRIVTLALNMYNFLHNGTVEFYNIDKLSLYKKLHELTILPAYGYIYIGQRKNRRKVDFETMQHEVVQDFTDENAFVDQVFEGEKKEGMVAFGWRNDTLMITYNGEEKSVEFDVLGIASVKTLEANYMMEPNVTIKEF